MFVIQTVKQSPPKKRVLSLDSSDEDEPQPKKKLGPKKKATAAVSKDISDDDIPKPKKKPAPKKKATVKPISDMSDDDDDEDAPKAKKKPSPKKTATAKKKGCDSDDMEEQPKKVSDEIDSTDLNLCACIFNCLFVTSHLYVLGEFIPMVPYLVFVCICLTNSKTLQCYVYLLNW